MESRSKVIITFIILIFLIAGLYIFTDWFSKITGYLSGDDPDVALAKCLTKKGVVLYGSDDCFQCEKQISLFGNSAFQSIDYKDCSKEPESCLILQKVPAWYINGSIIYGFKTLEELKDLSLCLE